MRVFQVTRGPIGSYLKSAFGFGTRGIARRRLFPRARALLSIPLVETVSHLPLLYLLQASLWRDSLLVGFH